MALDDRYGVERRDDGRYAVVDLGRGQHIGKPYLTAAHAGRAALNANLNWREQARVREATFAAARAAKAGGRPASEGKGCWEDTALYELEPGRVPLPSPGVVSYGHHPSGGGRADRRAWITDGHNDLGLREREDQRAVRPSPSPLARTDRLNR